MANHVWCLTIDHTNKPIGGLFKVVLEDHIVDLKKRVKEEKPNGLKPVDADQLEVWRCTEQTTIVDEEERAMLEEQVNKIFSDKKVNQLGGKRRIAELKLSKDETLFLRMPDFSSTISPSSSEDSKLSGSRAGTGDAARLLTSDEAERSQQVMFKLYTALWRRGEDAWAHISQVTEDYVWDPISPNETGEKTKATLVNLIPQLHWDPTDAMRRLLIPCFLVRDEYTEFDKYLDEHKSNHVVLLGQPGIGKTTYQTYSLLKRLCAGRPTIHAQTPDECYLFLTSGAYHIPGKSFHHSKDQAIIGQRQDALVLFDLNEQQSRIRPFKDWAMVVSTSPEPNRYKEWAKQVNASIYVMSTWSWAEVYFARPIAPIQRSWDELYTAFVKYGGTARNLFTKPQDQIDEDITIAIDNCTDIGTLFPTGQGFQDKTSHSLIAINPLVDNGSGLLKRHSFRGQIASRYILEQLLEVKGVDLADSMQNTFQMLFRSNGTRSASGILFEGAGHRYLFNNFKSPLDVRTLSGTRGRISVNLQHIQDIKSFRPVDIGSFNELEPNYYYQPLSSTTAGIDSFVLEVNDAGNSVSVILFQFTTSVNHPIDPRFLPRLWINPNPHTTMIQWKLVFVVPLEIEPQYQAQKWKSMESPWDHRISQYVLGVDSSKLWDAVRAPLQSRATLPSTDMEI